jgi:hypothetical protein
VYDDTDCTNTVMFVFVPELRAYENSPLFLLDLQDAYGSCNVESSRNIGRNQYHCVSEMPKCDI